jgi:hypothetical protein
VNSAKVVKTVPEHHSSRREYTEGQLLKQKVVTLQVGKAASLDLDRGELPGGNNPRAENRAVLLLGYSGGANPPAALLQKFDCNIVPSLEVFDNDTEEPAKRVPPSCKSA